MRVWTGPILTEPGGWWWRCCTPVPGESLFASALFDTSVACENQARGRAISSNMRVRGLPRANPGAGLREPQREDES